MLIKGILKGLKENKYLLENYNYLIFGNEFFIGLNQDNINIFSYIGKNIELDGDNFIIFDITNNLDLVNNLREKEFFLISNKGDNHVIGLFNNKNDLSSYNLKKVNLFDIKNNLNSEIIKYLQILFFN